MPAENLSKSTFFRWRLRSGARTPWQPTPTGFVLVPADAEGVEFHEGEPSLPPKREGGGLPVPGSTNFT